MKTFIINSSSVMEAGNHFKNGASLSRTSRGNFLRKMCVVSVVASLIFCGCGKNDDDDNGINNNINNELGDGQIEFKANPNENNIISFFAIAKKITIDWGDGKVDEYTPNGFDGEYIHEYLDQNIQTVSVETDSLTGFFSTIGTFRELRFGKCTKLQNVECRSALTVLDVKSTTLMILLCDRNQLTKLNVSDCTALELLRCDNNQLTELNVSGCTALKNLSCDNNQLTKLNVSGCTALVDVFCQDNPLTELNVSGCTALWRLYLAYNQFTELNVSNCTTLAVLDCHGNQLTKLNVSGCTALAGLSCENNQLTELNVSSCTGIYAIHCVSNQLSQSSLNALFGTLHSNTIDAFPKSIYIGGNPGADTCDRNIAEGRGWTVSDY